MKNRPFREEGKEISTKNRKRTGAAFFQCPVEKGGKRPRGRTKVSSKIERNTAGSIEPGGGQSCLSLGPQSPKSRGFPQRAHRPKTFPRSCPAATAHCAESAIRISRITSRGFLRYADRSVLCTGSHRGQKKNSLSTFTSLVAFAQLGHALSPLFALYRVLYCITPEASPDSPK